MITHEINLDMVPGGKRSEIWLSQYDADFVIVANLFARTGTFTVATGTTAAVRGTKPDGNGFSANASISGNAVTITGDQQMTVVAGRALFEVTLYKNNKELSTANFIINVERAPLDKDTPASHSQTRELVSIEDHADDLITAANDINSKVSDSEAYAVGTRGGVAVDSDDPAYHNNSKYYAESLTGNLAEEFSTSQAYTAGDYVIKDGVLYKFTSDHAAGAWTGSDAAAAEIGSDLSDLKDDLNSVSGDLNTVNYLLIAEYVSDVFLDGYNSSNNTQFDNTFFPCAFPNKNDFSVVINKIKLNIAVVGKLSIGWISEAYVGSAYDASKITIVNVLNITTTGTQEITLPHYVYLNQYYALIIGMPTDTCKIKYGTYGNNKGFWRVNGNSWSYLSGYSLNVTAFTVKLGISDAVTNDIYNVESVLRTNEFTETFVDGFNGSNNTQFDNTSFPCAFPNKNDYSIAVNKIKLNVAVAGKLSVGWISEAYVGSTYDSSKITIINVLDITTTGVQEIFLPKYVYLNQYYALIIGMPTDTCIVYYGTSGNDKGFWRVNGSSWAYAGGYSFNVTASALKLGSSNATKSYSYLQNVMVYGAIGNGVADDITAIQNAINANKGGTVYFPKGIYSISSSIKTYAGDTNYTNLIFEEGAQIVSSAQMDYMLDLGALGSASDLGHVRKTFRGGFFNGNNGNVRTAIIRINPQCMNLDMSDFQIYARHCDGIQIGNANTSAPSDANIHNGFLKCMGGEDKSGFKIYGTDNNISNIRMYFFFIGFDMYAGAQFLSDIHTLSDRNNSISLKMQSNIEVTLSEYYADSEDIFIDIANNCKLMGHNLYYYSYRDNDTKQIKVSGKPFITIDGYYIYCSNHEYKGVVTPYSNLSNLLNDEHLRIKGVTGVNFRYMRDGDPIKNAISSSGDVLFNKTTLSSGNWYYVGSYPSSSNVDVSIEFQTNNGISEIPLSVKANGTTLSGEVENWMITTDSNIYRIGFSLADPEYDATSDYPIIKVFIKPNTGTVLKRFKVKSRQINMASSLYQSYENELSTANVTPDLIYLIDCENKTVLIDE